MREAGFATRYVIDEKDTITSVSDSWDAFACDNSAPELVRDRVVGAPLWDFIAGSATREVYRRLLEQVRTHDIPLLIPFRCDSPDMRRFMRLVIAPIHEGAVQFDAVLVREEPRSPAAFLDPSVVRTDELMLMCSWCKKIPAGESEWLELEEAIPRLDLFGLEHLPEISHTICPNCELDLERA